jgi:O-acetylhomoserine (thiol)-lyase
MFACATSARPYRRSTPWLNLNGLETLSLRMERHCTDATTFARVLEKHSWVSAVSYAGLGSNLIHAIGGLTPCNCEGLQGSKVGRFENRGMRPATLGPVRRSGARRP